jgi:hypothetical protein
MRLAFLAAPQPRARDSDIILVAVVIAVVRGAYLMRHPGESQSPEPIWHDSSPRLVVAGAALLHYGAPWQRAWA